MEASIYILNNVMTFCLTSLIKQFARIYGTTDISLTIQRVILDWKHQGTR
jgi:hypothetical protein